jgi:hypothetical protein
MKLMNAGGVRSPAFIPFRTGAPQGTLPDA